jgi:peptidyl-prolyl cis-trans isomerase SurA
MKRWLGIIPLILLAVSNVQAGTVDRIVAKVNDDIITLSDLNREMAQIREDLASKYAGEQLEKEIKTAENQVLDELIRQKLLLQKANELGFSGNVDVQVSAAVQNIMKENNIPDMQALETALASQGMTLSRFREVLKNRMITQSLIQEFVSSRITLLSQEIDKYYRDHAADFTTPEEVSLSEILIPPGDNEKEAEARATDLYSRLRQGESFATLAAQYSKGPTAAKGGSIGSYVTSKLNPDLAKAIANVREGDVTAVQKIKEGFMICRVDTRKPATVKLLAEVRDEIRNRIWEQKFNPEYDRFVAQLKEDAYIEILGEIQ